MAYTRMTAADAAALIKNGDTIGLSGFTPAGSAKAVTRELAKIAQAEHEAGREFKVSIFTGASTGQSTDGVLTEAHAIKYDKKNGRVWVTDNHKSTSIKSILEVASKL